MSWLTLKPHELCTEALKAIADWWGSWGRETGEYYTLRFGNLTVHLYSSLQTAQREYKLITGHDWNPGWDGLASAPGEGSHETAQYSIWAPFKRTRKDIMLCNPWGLGHEFFHIIRSAFELMGDKTVADPDQVIKEGFYG